MLPYKDSSPITFAVFASDHEAVLAQGFINSSEAPAEPDRTGFPAKTVADIDRNPKIENICFLFIFLNLIKIQWGQTALMFRTT